MKLNSMHNIWLILIILIINSCSSDDEKKSKALEARRVKEKSEILNRLTKQYNIGYQFDTIRNLNYTIQLDGILDTDYQLLSEFILNDIIEVNNEYFIDIETFDVGVGTHFKFYLQIESVELDSLKTQNKPYDYLNYNFLVIKIDDIKKTHYWSFRSMQQKFKCTGKVIKYATFKP